MSSLATITVEDVAKVFHSGRWRSAQSVRAVNGVSFDVRPGETIGLVGESGCGKSTLARMILGAATPSRGCIRWNGDDVADFGRRQRKAYHASVQAVFQDPTSSLNPRMKIGSIIGEPLRIHTNLLGDKLRARVDELLVSVGLEPALASAHPHQLSGGMRQRVAIARALAVEPDVLVLDEPVSSLDVSVRAQIMNLLKQLQAERGFATILIAHDLASVRYMSDRILVMYLGRIVDEGPADDVLHKPLHPYTSALIDASLSVNPQPDRTLTTLEGEIPSPVSLPSGCPLHGRCPHAFEPCTEHRPDLRSIGSDRRVACHLHDPEWSMSVALGNDNGRQQ
jgi:oligopeptide/dipeptide ABC transporter ATP-binding protein